MLDQPRLDQASQTPAAPQDHDPFQPELSDEEKGVRRQMLKDAMDTGAGQPDTGALAITAKQQLAMAATSKLYEDPRWVEFQLDNKMARMFALSGMFKSNQKDIEGILAECYVKIQLGKTMGFDAAASMQGISVVGSKPYVEYQILQSRMEALGYSWDKAWHRKGNKIVGVTLFLKYKGQPVMEPRYDENGQPVMKTLPDGSQVQEAVQASASFTEEDASRIKQKTGFGLVALIQKDTYQNYPKRMFYSRALHDLQVFYVPGAMSAALPVGDEVNDSIEGDYVETFPQSNGQYAPLPAGGSGASKLRDRAAKKEESIVDTQEDEHGNHEVVAAPEKHSAEQKPLIPETPSGAGFGGRRRS